MRADIGGVSVILGILPLVVVAHPASDINIGGPFPFSVETGGQISALMISIGNDLGTGHTAFRTVSHDNCCRDNGDAAPPEEPDSLTDLEFTTEMTPTSYSTRPSKLSAAEVPIRATLETEGSTLREAESATLAPHPKSHSKVIPDRAAPEAAKRTSEVPLSDAPHATPEGISHSTDGSSQMAPDSVVPTEYYRNVYATPGTVFDLTPEGRFTFAPDDIQSFSKSNSQVSPSDMTPLVPDPFLVPNDTSAVSQMDAESPLISDNTTESVSNDSVPLMVPGDNMELISKGIYHTSNFSLVEPKNCLEVLAAGYNTSGVYTLRPYDCCPERRVSAFCDMETEGGGWTVIQRRDKFETQENFYRTWDEYVRGFGDLTREFWLGLDHIHALTNQSAYEGRFDLGDFEGNTRFAKYDTFSVGDAAHFYKLEIAGYSGDAEDSMVYHRGKKFTTKDKDNDVSIGNCAVMFVGAWWYGDCHHANLNGEYLEGPTGWRGVIWLNWRGFSYSLKKTEIKIRPTLLI